MNILGISAFYHDSAACLVQDGWIRAAAQEERFTRKKHDNDFPSQAIEYCLEDAGLKPADLDFVAFYDKPLLKFDRLLETAIAYAPRGFKLFMMGLPLWGKQKLHLSREIDRGLNRAYKGRYIFLEHHESHAASAFFPSPFDEAVILTLDGVGEWATGSIAIGRGNTVEMLKELRFPHSVGLLYSAFTYFTGFRVNSGEYKMMGLAPYGEPIYSDLILERLIDLQDDGSFRMDMSYFGYCHKDVMTTQKLDKLIGGPARKPGSPITQREMDIAASIQAVTEEIMLRMAHHAYELTGARNLAMAGGVALNCVGNGRILREGPYKHIWIQPAAGDAGGALGAALFVWHQLLEKPRDPPLKDAQQGSLLGPRFSNKDVRTFLDSVGAVHRYVDDEEQLVDEIANLIATENVVGHMADRMEFGPRALGSRSIIADARSPEMQSVINLKIKFRESFRPFAPAILREDVDKYFDMRPNEDSPYMLLVAPVRQNKRMSVNSRGDKGFDKLKLPRSVVPAVTHVDYSARVQTVDSAHHPRFYNILRRFKQKTGSSVVINTSFNVRGEPIVCTPSDAYRCFMASNMDALVIESFILLKSDQPAAKNVDPVAYTPQFIRGVGKLAKIREANPRPSDQTLRRFGFTALVGFGFLATMAWTENFVFSFDLGAARPVVVTILFLIATLSGGFSLVAPRANIVIYIGMTLLSRPIGAVVRYVIMGALFYGVITPVGLLFRVFGRDALGEHFLSEAETYWTDRWPTRSKDSYFQQF